MIHAKFGRRAYGVQSRVGKSAEEDLHILYIFHPCTSRRDADAFQNGVCRFATAAHTIMRWESDYNSAIIIGSRFLQHTALNETHTIMNNKK